VFEEIEGEIAEDGKGFCGASSSDARVILQSAIALLESPGPSHESGLDSLRKNGRQREILWDALI
jgi:hypothetical protein